MEKKKRRVYLDGVAPTFINWEIIPEKSIVVYRDSITSEDRYLELFSKIGIEPFLQVSAIWYLEDVGYVVFPPGLFNKGYTKRIVSWLRKRGLHVEYY